MKQNIARSGVFTNNHILTLALPRLTKARHSGREGAFNINPARTTQHTIWNIWAHQRGAQPYASLVSGSSIGINAPDQHCKKSEMF